MTKAKKKTTTEEETTTQEVPLVETPKVSPVKSSSSVISKVDIWRRGGKSSNVSKTNDLLEELIKKSGLK